MSLRSDGALGRRHKGGHKNKASRDNIEHAGHVFGSMAGEISPYIMCVFFFAKLIKVGCRWLSERDVLMFNY